MDPDASLRVHAELVAQYTSAVPSNSLASLISNVAYLYPRYTISWPWSRKTDQILGLKLIAHTAAPPIGLACTFTFSALTVLYQKGHQYFNSR